MKYLVSSEILRSEFVNEAKRISGQNLAACYQCGKCSAGCPICFDMDYTPNQIIRMVQLGMKDKVLSSRTIWLCASCETCTTRCPCEVDLAAVMDALRRLALRENIVPKDEEIELFNEIFLRNVRGYGRSYDLRIIGSFNVRSGHFLRNIMKAPTMLLRGKVALLPHWTKRVKEVRKIFKKAKELESKL